MTCRNSQRWAGLLLSFLVGWSNIRLSHQPRPEPAGSGWARSQLELKGSSSELEAGGQPTRNPKQREQNRSQCNPCQPESVKSFCFPAVHGDPGSEQAWSVGEHWRGVLTSARSSQGQLLSGGLAIVAVPLSLNALLIILG